MLVPWFIQEEYKYADKRIKRPHRERSWDKEGGIKNDWIKSNSEYPMDVIND
jgi:hypothetical protein